MYPSPPPADAANNFSFFVDPVSTSYSVIRLPSPMYSFISFTPFAFTSKFKIDLLGNPLSDPWDRDMILCAPLTMGQSSSFGLSPANVLLTNIPSLQYDQPFTHDGFTPGVLSMSPAGVVYLCQSRCFFFCRRHVPFRDETTYFFCCHERSHDTVNFLLLVLIMIDPSWIGI
jgi:hypothetical protein